MTLKLLFIFVEGDDDERLFEKIIKPIFEKRHIAIEIIKYATKPKKSQFIKKLIKSIHAMDADYIFTCDNDNFRCINSKLTDLKNRMSSIDTNKIQIIVEEIESWYLAGLEQKSSKILGINEYKTTDRITKETFLQIIPRKYESHIDFRQEILKYYNLKHAMKLNKSLKYFANKYNLITN